MKTVWNCNRLKLNGLEVALFEQSRVYQNNGIYHTGDA